MNKIRKNILHVMAAWMAVMTMLAASCAQLTVAEEPPKENPQEIGLMETYSEEFIEADASADESSEESETSEGQLQEDESSKAEGLADVPSETERLADVPSETERLADVPSETEKPADTPSDEADLPEKYSKETAESEEMLFAETEELLTEASKEDELPELQPEETSAEEIACESSEEAEPTEDYPGDIAFQAAFEPGGLLYFPLPLSCNLITSMYGERSGEFAGFHTGIDISANYGTGIFAAAAGTVIISDYGEVQGNYVTIDHGNGVFTEYHHMSERAVRIGDHVEAGQEIGFVGATGVASGPHLHFMLMFSDHGYDTATVVDPYDWLLPDIPDVMGSVDLSSNRLMAGLDSAPLMFADSLISSYKGVYMFQFEDEQMMRLAYYYYLHYGASFVEADTGIMIAEGEAAGDVSADNCMTETDNPLTKLLSEGNVGSYDIALIDTGADGADAAISMTGDAAGDDNGHGTKMLNAVREIAPEASVLSIKALGADGKGDVSAVYAAIEYAIAQNVKVINLSVSAQASSDSRIIEDAINEAAANGIIVVGAAGNNGSDAAYFIPGGIAGAVIAGAAAENGARLALSNYGSTVDYNIVAATTSEAAAKLSGFIAKNGFSAIDKELNKGLIYATDYVPAAEEQKDSVTVMVKYLLVAEDKVNNDDTIDSVWREKPDAVVTQVQEIVEVTAGEDGMYAVDTLMPYLNGTATKDPLDAIFTRANDKGVVISSGVNYDISVKRAVFDPSAIEGREDTDFGDIQIQILVPVEGYRSTAYVNVNIDNRIPDIDVVADSKISADAYLSLRFPLISADTTGRITTANIVVLANGSDKALVPNADFAYDETDGQIYFAKPGIEYSSLRIIIADKDAVFSIAGYSDGTSSAILADSDRKAGQLGTVGYIKADLSGYSAGQVISNNVKLLVGADYGGSVPADAWGDLFWSTRTKSSMPVTIGERDGDSNEARLAIGFPKKVAGLDFTIYKDAACTQTYAHDMSYWDSSYNAPIACYCHHTNIPNSVYATGSAKMWATAVMRLISKSADGSQAVIGIETKEWFCELPYDDIQGQTTGVTFQLAVVNSGSLSLTKSVSEGTSSLTVRKTVTQCYDPNREFDFRITITGPSSGNSYTGAHNGVAFNSSGVGTFKLKSNGSITFTGIPAGSKYSVQEINIPKGYSCESVNPQTGTLGSQKQYNGNFQFYIELFKDAACTQKASDISGTHGGMTFVSGTAAVDLRNGTITATGIPAGYYYKITESNTHGYTSSIPSAGTTGQISANSTAAVSVSNSITGKSDTVTFVNKSALDPTRVLITKTDATDTSIPQGAATLEGAQFAVKFYEGVLFTKASDAPLSASRTWTFKTVKNEDGDFVINMALPECFVSGDALYKDSTGITAMPYGTAVIIEKSAPAGYLVDDTPYIITVDFDTSLKVAKTNYNGATGEKIGDEFITVDNPCTITNDTRKFSVLVRKFDEETGEPAKDDYTTAGIRFAVVNRTGGRIVLDTGKETEKIIEDGRVVDILTIGEDGTVLSDKLLVTGGYEVYELREDATIDVGDFYPVISEASAEDAAQLLGVSEYANHWYLYDEDNHDSFEFTEESEDGDVAEPGIALTSPDTDGADSEDGSAPDEKGPFLNGHLHPEISTRAWDLSTGTNTGAKTDKARIEDVVSFTGFLRDTDYKFHATIVDKDDPETVYGESETIINTSETGTDGSVTMPALEFDASDIDGHTLVVFEEASRIVSDETDEEGNPVWTVIAEHKDLLDEGQSIYYGSCETTLANADGSKRASAEEEITLTDRVKYHNLIPGETYTMQGRLMKKIIEDGKEAYGVPATDDDGREIVSAVVEFTPNESDGYVDIEFTFRGVNLAGEEVVAFETCTQNGGEVLLHQDINDEEQTMQIAEIPSAVQIPERPEGKQEPDVPQSPQTGLKNDRTLLYLAVFFLAAAFSGIAAVFILKNRKAFISIILIVMVTVIAVFCMQTYAADEFSDVTDCSKSYYRPIYWAVDRGIALGYRNGNFGPEDSCTRSQFVTMLWRFAGKPSSSASTGFSDVNKSMSSYKAIQWAVGSGIIVGYKDGTFRPGAAVTRRQVCVMLWRYQGRPKASAKVPFTDVPGSDPGYKAVQWGSQSGVVKGSRAANGSSVFKPDDNCLRQHIVTFFYRFAREVMGENVKTASPAGGDLKTLNSSQQASSGTSGSECSHQWVYLPDISIEKDCCFGGAYYYKCSKCGEFDLRKESAPGHDWQVVRAECDKTEWKWGEWTICCSCLNHSDKLTRFEKRADGNSYVTGTDISLDKHLSDHYHGRIAGSDEGWQTYSIVTGYTVRHYEMYYECSRCGAAKGDYNNPASTAVVELDTSDPDLIQMWTKRANSLEQPVDGDVRNIFP